MRLFPLTAHQSDAESLAHGEGRERAVLVDALEQVQPLDQRVGALVREVVRRGHAEHLRLEPREVLTLRVAALEAERGARARLRHAEHQVVNGAVRPERARVEEDAPRDRDFKEHDALTHAERAHHCSLVAHRRINKARPARLERRERVGQREREHAQRVPTKGDGRRKGPDDAEHEESERARRARDGDEHYGGGGFRTSPTNLVRELFRFVPELSSYVRLPTLSLLFL